MKKKTKICKDIIKADDDLHLYVCLQENNEFPPWFELGKEGFLKIPMKNRKRGTSNFDYKNLYVGQNHIYKFYLTQIHVTETITELDNFIIALDIATIVKPKIKKSGERYLKRILLEYEILYPVFQ